MDPFTWLLAFLGPVWSGVAIIVLTLIARRAKNAPVRDFLTRILNRLKGNPATPSPLTPANPANPANPSTPLRDILDRIRLLFKDHPAAEIVAEDPGYDVSRLAQLRMFADAYAAHLERDILTQASLLSRFRAPDTRQATVPGGPPLQEGPANPVEHWPGGVNVMGSGAVGPGAKLAAIALLILFGSGVIGCGRASERPCPPAMKASVKAAEPASVPDISPVVVCSKCHADKTAVAKVASAGCICGENCKCKPGDCPRGCPVIAPPDKEIAGFKIVSVPIPFMQGVSAVFYVPATKSELKQFMSEHGLASIPHSQ